MEQCEEDSDMFKRFYSLPPRKINYPYILVNIKDVKELEKRNYDHCIVDCGIYDLLKPPFRHDEEKLKKWQELEVTNGWKVVPDCPSLLYEFGIDINYLNTDYSKELIENFYIPTDKSHLPVLQSHIVKNSESYKNSVKDFVKWFKRNYDEPDALGMGSACKAGNKKMVLWICHYLRLQFPNSWIHAFGLRMQHFKAVYRIIDSFDSMSWKFMRPNRQKQVFGKAGIALRSANTIKEEVVYYNDYINDLKEINNRYTSLLEFKELTPINKKKLQKMIASNTEAIEKLVARLNFIEYFLGIQVASDEKVSIEIE